MSYGSTKILLTPIEAAMENQHVSEYFACSSHRKVQRLDRPLLADLRSWRFLIILDNFFASRIPVQNAWQLVEPICSWPKEDLEFQSLMLTGRENLLPLYLSFHLIFCYLVSGSFWYFSKNKSSTQRVDNVILIDESLWIDNVGHDAESTDRKY